MLRRPSAMIFEQLTSSIRDSDLQRFSELLRSCSFELWETLDAKSNTCMIHAVFHALSTCFLKQDKVYEFATALLRHFEDRYSDLAPDAIKRTLKIRESQTQKTALHCAILCNQKV